MGKVLSVILISVAFVVVSFLLTYGSLALLGWLIGFEVTWKSALAIWYLFEL